MAVRVVDLAQGSGFGEAPPLAVTNVHRVAIPIPATTRQRSISPALCFPSRARSPTVLRAPSPSPMRMPSPGRASSPCSILHISPERRCVELDYPPPGSVALKVVPSGCDAAFLCAEVRRLEFENERLHRLVADQARDSAHQPASHLQHLAQGHAQLFDRLAKNRDDEYLLLLDHYEDVACRLDQTMRNLQDSEKEVVALRRKLQHEKRRDSSRTRADIGQLRGGQEIWVCLTPSDSRLLLHPNVPESALSSASAAKVAEFFGGAYQQQMRTRHLTGGDGGRRPSRSDSHSAELQHLRQEVDRLQHLLAARNPLDQDAEIQRLRQELQHCAGELAQRGDHKGPVDGVEPKGTASPKAPRGKRHVNPKAVQREWEQSLRETEPVAPKLYCISEYGRILHDNDAMERHKERRDSPPPPSRPPPKASQWSQWTRSPV